MHGNGDDGDLVRKRREAEALFPRTGITFAAYGEADHEYFRKLSAAWSEALRSAFVRIREFKV